MSQALNVHRTMVDAVHRGDKAIPENWCPVVERITTGGIRADALRGDLRWVRVACTDWPWHGGKPLLDVELKRVRKAAPASDVVIA